MPGWLSRSTAWNIRPQGIQLSYPKFKSGRWVLRGNLLRAPESQGPTPSTRGKKDPAQQRTAVPSRTTQWLIRIESIREVQAIVSLIIHKWPTFVIFGRQGTYCHGLINLQLNPLGKFISAITNWGSPCLRFRIMCRSFSLGVWLFCLSVKSMPVTSTDCVRG